ncbi:MAG TPA: Calx-beta domain-containing protein, partial [Pyrinomonadaceae bacterium]
AARGVTINFQVAINNPYAGGPNVSNQGSVSGSNFWTIVTDDPETGVPGDATLTPVKSTDIRVNDAKLAEPAGPNTANMVFTVSLSQPASGSVSINFTTANDTATAGNCGSPGADYVTTSGQVAFSAGEQVKTINVPICSDVVTDDGETFFVNLSGAVGGTVKDAQGVGTITPNTPGTFIISELRTRGPAGAGDDFVELYNNSSSPQTVAASDASGGYGVFKMGADCGATPVLVATVPNGTVIPARGHYLLRGSAYSLTNYGGAGTAAGDLTTTSDIEDDANVAVFSTANVSNISSVNRLDAVGFGSHTGAVCDLLREGANPAAAGALNVEYSYFRKQCDFVAGVGCTVSGNPKDTNDNAADFSFADTQGTLIPGVTQRLGTPGPENLASPIRRDDTGVYAVLLDSTKSSSSTPNRQRDTTPGDPTTSPLGTLSIRRKVQNVTGATITRLRFRIVDLTTFPSPGGGVADLRVITSSAVIISGITDATTCASTGTPTTAPCQVTAQAMTLEAPPSQPMGGGYNSTVSVSIPGGLANNASINVNVTLGVVQSGTFRFLFTVEALP